MGPSKSPKRFRGLPQVWMTVGLVLLATFTVACGAAKVGGNAGSSQPVLAPSTASVSFGNVPVGSTKTVPLSLTNQGAQDATIQVSQVSVSGKGFNAAGANPPITLAVGQQITLNVTFMPSSSGTVNGSVSIVSTASNPTTTVTLSGTGTVSGQLGVSAGSLSFGSVQVGSGKTLPLTLTNSAGPGATIKVSQISASGSGFSVSGATLPLTLTAGQSFTVNVGFKPTGNGAASGSVNVVSDASNPNVTVTLSGTGTSPGQLTVSPATLNFGNVTVGGSQSLAGSLSAGSGGITVASASWNGVGFALSGVSFPFTLVAGQSMPFTVTFAPQTAGSVTGTVTFISNATNSPSTEQLTGTGTQPVQHSVDLSWNASTSSVQGYYVYRGTQNGGPYAKISPLDGTLTYTDTNVAGGQTDYYVVTALGTDNVESMDSNQVVALIP